jgi:hypothetical protein
MFPVAVIPSSVSGICRRKHPILRRPPSPIACAPGLFHPDIAPITISGFTYYFNFDTRRHSMFLKKIAVSTAPANAPSEACNFSVCPSNPDFLI